MSERIGIFKDEGDQFGFFAEDMSATIGQVLSGTSDLLGQGIELIDNPPEGTRAKHVGDVVIDPVTDPATYIVQATADQVSKPDVNRKPTKDPGSWETQSIIFSKDKFKTVEECKRWIADHDEYGDYGYDETEQSFRYRQYDPQYFSQFRNLAISDGITLVRGVVAAKGNKAAAKAADEIRDLIEDMREAVRSVNQGIMAKGIKLLSRSAEVRKDKDGGEERFILGLVLEPTDGTDGAPFKPDTQDDVYSADTIRKTAHGWMENYGHVDLMHSWEALSKDDVRLLETYIAPVSFKIGEGDRAYDVVKGSWLAGMRVLNDALWTAVKSNEIGAYSIGGSAEREQLQQESKGDDDASDR